jgi:hypothetical protein
MALTAAILAALLTQAPEAVEAPPTAASATGEAPPAAADPANPDAAAAAATATATTTAAPKKAVFKPGTLTSSEDIAKELEKIQAMPTDQQIVKMQELMKRLPDLKGMAPGAFPGQMQASYFALPDADQASVAARYFFNQLIAGNARGALEIAGVPFQLEDRRLNSAEEVFQEWLKSLRAKRSDLLTLYGIEILTPAEMEKKYGKPPARLANLPWRTGKTMIAVANLSGHAAVAVLRQHPAGMGWQVVGYHD